MSTKHKQKTMIKSVNKLKIKSFKELKSLCKEYKLPSRGTKHDLLQRLTKHLFPDSLKQTKLKTKIKKKRKNEEEKLENKVEFNTTLEIGINDDLQSIVVFGYIRNFHNNYIDLLIPEPVIDIILMFCIQKEIWLMIYAQYKTGYGGITHSQIEIKWVDLNVSNTFCDRYNSILINDDFEWRARGDSAYALIPNDDNNHTILYRIGFSQFSEGANRKYNLTKGIAEMIPPLISGQPTIGHRAIYSDIHGLFVVTGQWQFGAAMTRPYIDKLLVSNNDKHDIDDIESKYEWKTFPMTRARKGASACLWNKGNIVNEKLFVAGGSEYDWVPTNSVDVFDLSNNMQNIVVSDMNYFHANSGICEWKRRNHSNMFVVGGVCYRQKTENEIEAHLEQQRNGDSDNDDIDRNDEWLKYDGEYDQTFCNIVEEYDGYKDVWYVLPSTNYQHANNPSLTIMNEYGVLVVLGGMDEALYINEWQLDIVPNCDVSKDKNNGGQIELFDPRDSTQKWMLIKHLNKFSSDVYGPTLQQIMFMM